MTEGADIGEVTPVYEVNAPRVLGETIDGETVIIDSRTGAYYTLNDSATHIWLALKGGPVTATAVGTALESLYGIDPQVASEISAASLALLYEYEIVRTVASAPQGAITIDTLSPHPLVFSEPTIERFDDLEHLLLLDPVHDVAPEHGWPIAKADG